MTRKVKLYEVGVVTRNDSLGDEYSDKTVYEAFKPDANSESEAIEKTVERYPQGDWELERVRYVKKVFVK